jgi:hypothetical protein
MRIYRCLSLMVLLMLLGASFLLLPTQADLTWSIQTVDKNGATGSRSIVLDSNNNPHIAYCDYENGNWHNPLYVMYASWNGSDWNIENVTQGRGSIDLALDSNNNPHIVFNDGTGRLLYASFDSTGWNIQTVDNDGSSGSLALDSAGNPHIAYLTTRRALRYASWTATGWRIQPVDSSEIFDMNLVSLALDASNNPHILYGYNTPGSQNILTIVKYAAYNSSGWYTQTVVSDAAVGGLGNIALDSNGYPHFTYIFPRINRTYGSPQYTNLNTTLTYVSWNGSAWNTQKVASNVNWRGLAGYLALDSHNYPHIAYYNSTPDGYSGALMYSSWTGTAWDTQTVDSNSSLDAGPIALDSNGTPHIAYLGQPVIPSNYVAYLKYAITTEPTQTPTPTATSAVGFPLNLLSPWIAVPVITVIVLIALAYFWKKKIGKAKKESTTLAKT